MANDTVSASAQGHAKGRYRLALVAILLVALTLLGASVLQANFQEDGPADSGVRSINEGLTFDVSEPVVPVLSQPLDDLPLSKERRAEPGEINPLKGSPIEDGWSIEAVDALAAAGISQVQTPDPLFTFEGMGNFNQYIPPDTIGDVGPNHYIQMVNVKLAVYDKTGSLLYGPVDINTLWSGAGNNCELTNHGDPIVVYDDMADRWVLSQFSLNGPLYQCVAVSQTPDPLGSYYLYAFEMPDFPDYPKFGAWLDGYYVGTNTGFPNAYYAHVFDRVSMLAGLPATRQSFGGIANFLMPSDADGIFPPPAGAPNYFYTFYDEGYPDHPPGVDRLAIYAFHVDWNNPANSTFTLAQELPITPYNYTVCGFFVQNCVPQPGTGQTVDSLSYWPMWRLQYRNFGPYEGMVGNFTVDLDGTDKAAIRWFELRKEGANPWSLYQEGTYAPDNSHRWMGSIAMDGSGHIALGYSVSDNTITKPSIRYATRLLTDPPGTLQAEASVIEANGVQTGHYRWGDYSAMVVDPVDQCTFWYTNEYHEVNDVGFSWNTRVGIFRNPQCTGAIGPTGTLQGTVTDTGTSLPIAGAKVLADDGTIQITLTADENGDYSGLLPVGTYDVTASAFGYFPQTVTGVVILEDQTTVQNFALTAAPAATISGVVTDGTTGWPLYAQIDVDDVPTGPFWSDPVTGFYSLSLPEGATYTFHVSTFVGGYLSETRDVGPVVGNLTEDFALNADLDVCIAPGYTPVPSGSFFDDFESGYGNWTMTGLWNPENQADACGSLVTPFPSPTNAAYYGIDGVCTFNNGAANSGTLTLNSPVSVGAGSALTFWSYEQTECGGNCSYDKRQTQVSTDGGATWITINEGDTENVWHQKSVDLSPYPGSALIRFHFDTLDSVGNDYFGWMVDDVDITTYTCVPPAEGGLVVGNVYDVNTLDPINGAWVTNETGETVFAVETPDDPAVDDAFYTVYSLSGSQVHTATFDLYGEDVQTVTVIDSDTVEQDFYLPSGFVVTAPTAFDVALEFGTNTTLPLTLSDTGGANVEFTIFERPGSNPYAPDAQSLPRYEAPRIEGPAPDGRAFTDPGIRPVSDDGSGPSAAPPERYAGPEALVFYSDRATFDDDNPGLPIEGFENTLVPDFAIISCLGAFNSNTNNDCFAPGGILEGISLSSVPTDEMVVIGDGALGNPSALVGPNQFADDHDIFLNDVHAVGFDLWSPLGAATYDIFIYGLDDVLLGQDSIVGGVSGTFWGVFSDVPITRIRTVSQSGTGELFDDIAFGGAADVPWVSQEPISGTIPANGDFPVSVTFDAAEVPIPGQYTAFLDVAVDTPQLKVVVPLTLTVSCASCGTLQGDITDGFTGDPLVSTVRITNTVGFDFTFEDVTSYSIELFPGQYNVTASAPGYVSQTAIVDIVTGVTTIQDFALLPAQAILEYSPPSIFEAMSIGDVVSNTVTVTNSGTIPLEWQANIGGSQGPGGALRIIPRATTMPENANFNQAPPVGPVKDPVSPQGASSAEVAVQPTEPRLNQGSILHVYTSDTTQSVQRALNELGYVYDSMFAEDWTFIDFSPYDTIIIGMDGGGVSSASVQKVRTDVIDAGKRLIFMGGTCWQDFAIGVNTYLVLNDTFNYCWQISSTPHWTLVDSGHPLAGGLPANYNFIEPAAAFYQIRVNDPDIEPVAINGDGYHNYFLKNAAFPLLEGSLAATGDFIWFTNSPFSSYWSNQADFDLFKQLLGNTLTFAAGPEWAYAVPESGTVQPGESATFEVVFDATSLYQVGQYTAELSFSGNFVNDPPPMPLTMDLDCPTCGFLEGAITDAFTGDPLTADIHVTGPGGFDVTLSGDSYALAVVPGTYDFEVSADGYLPETASVTVAQGQTVVTDFALLPIVALLEYSPAGFEVTVALGNTLEETLVLTNVGTVAFDFTLMDVEVPAAGAPAAPMTICPPDSFGYTCTDSTEPGGPAYDFEDISGTGTPVFLSDDEVSGPIPIGFDFDFYGTAYNQIYISSNGFLTVLPGQDSGCCEGQPLPTPGNPDGLIAGWWSDLYPPGGGTITYQSLGTAPRQVFIIQFTDVDHCCGSGNFPVTFQYKLFEGSNNIEVHYQMLDTQGNLHSAGIENDTGSVGLQYYFGTGVPAASDLAVCYLYPGQPTCGSGGQDAPWVSEDPEFGTIEAGESMNVAITFDATVVTQTGTYTANLYFGGTFDNDVEPAPLIMHVVDEGNAAVGMSDPQTGSGTIGTQVEYAFTVTNMGNIVDEFALETSGVWPAAVSLTTTGPLDPGQSVDVTVTVDIPTNIADGASDVTTLTATSGFDPGVSASTTATTTGNWLRLNLPVIFRAQGTGAAAAPSVGLVLLPGMIVVGMLPFWRKRH